MSRPGKRRRLRPGAEREWVAARLRTAYEAGRSIRDLMDETEYSYGKVHALLTQAGTTLRPRGGRNHRPHRPPTS